VASFFFVRIIRNGEFKMNEIPVFPYQLFKIVFILSKSSIYQLMPNRVALKEY
jgi:hypothetical protein